MTYDVSLRITTSRQLIVNTDSLCEVQKPSTKYKIQDADEMQLFMHMKRKGASATKNKKAYARRDKHQNRRGYDY